MVLISLYNFLYYWKNQNYVGAHTIGVSHCSVIARRLYNFTGKGDADPSLEPDYANKLWRECGSPLNPSTTVDMDPDQSSLSFDSHYFKIVSQNKGLFQSDATLLTNPQSAQMVEMLQHGRLFWPIIFCALCSIDEEDGRYWCTYWRWRRDSEALYTS